MARNWTEWNKLHDDGKAALASDLAAAQKLAERAEADGKKAVAAAIRRYAEDAHREGKYAHFKDMRVRAAYLDRRSYRPMQGA